MNIKKLLKVSQKKELFPKMVVPTFNFPNVHKAIINNLERRC